jgi:DNA-binding response OmpR family regulator
VGERILIIDDEPSVHDVARVHPEREPSEALTAFSGRDGLALASGLWPGLVILDRTLPDLTEDAA